MIVPLDDYIGHQAPTSFAYPATSDPSWMERYWYCGYDVPNGDVVFMVGLGYHPNCNVIDAFALVTKDNIQHNFRGSRQIDRSPVDTVIGPLSFTIVEPFRHHRIQLASNESGISMDIHFHGVSQPNDEGHHFRRSRIRVIEDSTRFSQNGRVEGWVEIDGKRIEVTREGWRGHRDHSWGIRRYLRTDENHPPLTPNVPMLYNWFQADMGDEALHTFVLERSPGIYSSMTGDITGKLDEDRRRKRIVGIEHDYQWEDDPVGQQFRGGAMTLLLEDGGKRHLSLRVLNSRTFHKGGGYGGLNGIFHGDDLGELHIAHERWNLRDPEHRRIMKNLSEYTLEVREGDKVGYGVIECLVGKGYPKYEVAQRFPTMF